MKQEDVEYKAGDIVLEGRVAYPAMNETDVKPVILIVHDWSGCREFAYEKARYFAERGFIGFAVDLYGKGKRGSSTDVSVNQALMQPLLDDRAAIVTRLQAALEVVQCSPNMDENRVVALGFCFGGLCVLDWARSGATIAGVVSIHGLLFPPDPAPNQKITTKVLVLHGQEDKMVPPEQVQAFQQEMTAAQAEWQMHIFGNAMHAFTNPEANSPKFAPEANPPSLGVQFNQLADQRTWEMVGAFTAECFF